MKPGTLPTLAFVSLIGALAVPAVSATPQDPDLFEAPRRLHAGKSFLGEKRMYPSPVFQDIDGDKRADIVVGDLFGRLTWARQALQDGRLVGFAKEAPLEDRSGRPLKFHNW